MRGPAEKSATCQQFIFTQQLTPRVISSRHSLKTIFKNILHLTFHLKIKVVSFHLLSTFITLFSAVLVQNRLSSLLSQFVIFFVKIRFGGSIGLFHANPLSIHCAIDFRYLLHPPCTSSFSYFPRLHLLIFLEF